MQRAIEDDLIEWSKMTVKRPILLDGGPSTGKTFTALALGEKAFEGKVLRIECSQEKNIVSLFTQNQNLGGMLAAIERAQGSQIDFERTLIIIDNFHMYPAALSAVRDLCDRKRNLNIMILGSLTRDQRKKFTWLESSFELHRMRPLSFLEFLNANSNEHLSQAIITKTWSTKSLHSDIIAELRKYILIGGMPEVVESWVKDQDIEKVREIQKSIVAKFFEGQPRGAYNPKLLQGIMQTIAENAASQMDYGSIAPKLALSEVKHSVDYLEDRGIVQRVFPSTPNSVPEVNFKVKMFKSLFLDVGLQQVVSGLDQRLDQGDAKTFEAFEHILYDQFIGQELMHAQDGQIFYWASSVKESQAVVNYLVNMNDKGCPAVLAQHDTSMQDYALDICLGSYPECDKGYILSTEDTAPSQPDKIKRYPLYCAIVLGAGYF